MATSRARLLALACALCAGAASGDCPPRPEWNGGKIGLRSLLMENYHTLSARCPLVEIAILPQRVVVDGHHLASMGIGIVFEWLDPNFDGKLTGPREDYPRVKLNSSEVWMPRVKTAGPENRVLGPRGPADQYTEVDIGTARITSFYRTTLRGFCEAASPEAWPRDGLVCRFHIQPVQPADFKLDHQHTIAKLVAAVQDFRAQLDAESREMERMSAWRQQSLDSSLQADAIIIEARLQRLPGQLSAEVVQPACAVAALVPASAALPPGADARPALLALSVVLHAALLLSLPRLVADLGGSAPPRTLLLYRDLGLLLLVVVLQWLLSLRLASRRRPLPAWGQSLARALAVLRTPLLLPALPALPAPTPAPPTSRLVDQESVGLAEVLDRLTFLAAGAAYLASAVVSLQ